MVAESAVDVCNIIGALASVEDEPKPVLRARFYRTPAGIRPVRDWLRSLPKEVRREIGADIARVQWQWPIGKPLVDSFGGGLFEVRTAYDGEQYRVLFYVEGQALILVHAESAGGTMVLVPWHSQEDTTYAAGGDRARTEANEGGHMRKQATDELEELLEELGELEDVRALARKKIVADELRKAMKAQRVTPAEMARRMKTSRPTVYRLLDPAEPGATLDTLARASAALGLELQIRLIPRSGPKKHVRSPKKAAA
jgi:antitoxin HicB